FPGLTGPVDASLAGYLTRWAVLLVKVGLVVALIIQLRWTLPRFRFDQLTGLAWRGLIPLGIVNFAACIVFLSFDLSRWWLALLSIAMLWGAAEWNAGSATRRSQGLAVAVPSPRVHSVASV